MAASSDDGRTDLDDPMQVDDGGDLSGISGLVAVTPPAGSVTTVSRRAERATKARRKQHKRKAATMEAGGDE